MIELGDPLMEVLVFIAVGFAAQMIDGAIGMAYGLISTTILLSLGISAPVASSSVHAAEVFTTAASGAAHWRFGNIDFALIRRLAPAGILGGVIGAYVLTAVPAETIRPFVSGYLLIMGGVILWRALTKRGERRVPPNRVGILGFFGGFLDAAGGGGWGPIVTTTLVGQGTLTRIAIGSTSLAEFFVTTAISVTFVETIGLELWPIITGLIIGGAMAAPFAAYAARRLPDKTMMILVAAVITLLSLREIVRAVVS
jgi:uncharacterized membrane protein YfcA